MLNHDALSGICQSLKLTSFKTIIALIFLPLLVLISGCIDIPEAQLAPAPEITSIPAVTTPPAIEPFIDQALQQLLFTFEIDMNSSYGFERKYLEHGTPVFVLSKGKSAAIVLSISSLSNRTVQISLEEVKVHTDGVNARLEPESYALKPDEQAKLELNITISPAATPTPEMPLPDELIALSGDGFAIGKSFKLKINQRASEQCTPLPYLAYDMYPAPEAKDVPVAANISVTFSRPPPIVKLEAEPKIEISNITREIVGITSGRFIFYPAVPLKPETNYMITIIYGQEEAPEGYCRTSSTTWRFTTGSGE